MQHHSFSQVLEELSPERSGVVNVGLEGIMVMGAFSGIVFNLEFAETFGKATPWIAVLVGGIVGLIFL